jgi:phage terminase large subunit-like protein
MGGLMVPVDQSPWPSLGGQVCDFIERNLVFGPGDLVGQPAVLDDEKRALIYRIYEVYPQGHRMAGRRRFKRVGISLRKGSAKTEFAAWIAACELHPEGPVRCVGWTEGGEPIGGGVTDPYIPMVAYTEEQSEELAYGALRVILERSHLKDDFLIGFERIERKKGTGKAVALAAAPNSTDGARTTFQHFDETHRMTLQRLRDAHRTMLANVPKRVGADAWSLETTTAPEPGTGSVAEATMDYAVAVANGKVSDVRLFFFHRQAGKWRGENDPLDLTTSDGIRAAIVEASGSVAEWSDIDSIIEQWNDPGADRAYLERVWLNRLVQGSSQAFDVERWKALAMKAPVADGRLITLGFDGARFHDSTSVVATDVETGYQWMPGLWEKPIKTKAEEWKVPAEEVDALIRELFARFNVWRLYADPPYWEDWVSKWIGEYGKERVIEWWTNRRKQMSHALLNFKTAITAASISHDGDARLTRHIANSRRDDLPGWRDEQGKALWLIRKERPDSPNKIDAAMASVLSWEARTDAIAAGAVNEQPWDGRIYSLEELANG